MLLRHRQAWPLLLTIGAFLAIVVGSVNASLAATNGSLVYAVDDAYIHMAVAKNLVRHGVWGCTPFQFSSSSSSPLWIALLAGIERVTGVRDWIPLILNVVFAVATLWVADRYLRRVSAPGVMRLASLVAIGVASSLPSLVLLGMEHTVHICLTIAFAGAAALTLEQEPGREIARREIILLCVLGGLLAASRYEGVFLVAIVCVTFAARGRLASGAVVAAASCVPLAIFGVISISDGAFFLPNSLLLKAVTPTTRFGGLLKPLGADDVVFLRGHTNLLLVSIIACAIGIGSAINRRVMWRPQTLLPAWLLAAILLHGHFTFSPTYWVYRYDVYLIGLAAFVVAMVAADFATHARVSGIAAAAAILLTTSFVTNYRAVFPNAEIAGAVATNIEHVAIAKFVAANYPNETIAINDLGALAYYTDARIHDIVGLGDLEPLLRKRQSGAFTREDVRAWMGSQHARIAILQVDWSLIVPLIPPQWLETSELDLPPDGKRVGFFAIDVAEAPRLRAKVEEYFDAGRRGVRYRVREF